MAKPRIITGLDIGTSSIRILSAFKKPGQDNFEVVSQLEEPAFGIRKGVVVDVARTSEIISSLLQKAEADSNIKINEVYANVGGGHINCISSHGLVSVSRADQKISEEDVGRVIQAAKTFSLPSNKEIIDFFPAEYFVDGEAGVKEPVGMEGVRLEADVLMLCCFSPYLKNSTQAILNSGLRINDVTPSPLASGKAVLTPREKELGAIVLDIGAGTTSMAVFEEGSLIGVSVFPIGSAHITNDIAVCLKTDIDTAEKIKLEFGSLSASGRKSRGKEKKIKIDAEEPLSFSPKMVSEIIEARVKEIFGLVAKELKKVSKKGLLPGGVILTGGLAKLPGIKDLAKKELKLPCRIGLATNFASLPDDPSLATLCGLVEHGFETEEDGGDFQIPGKGLKDKFRKMLKMFIP